MLSENYIMKLVKEYANSPEGKKKIKIKLLHYILIIILLRFCERFITESLQVFYYILCYDNIVVKIRRKEGGIKNDK